MVMLHFICRECPDHTCHADTSSFSGKMPDGCFITRGKPAVWTVDPSDIYLLQKSANLGSQRALLALEKINQAVTNKQE